MYWSVLLIPALTCGAILTYLKLFAWNLRTESFRRLYESAVHDTLDVMEEVGVTFWLTEGTLIWALRYGTNHPTDIEDVVDDDVDVMVEVASEAHWQTLSDRITRLLLERGWCGANRRSTSPVKGMRVDKLQIFKPGMPFQRTHVDLHSYIRDDERRVALSHGDPSAYPFQAWHGAMPLDLIHPMVVCACYGRSVPCPRRAVHILENWHAREYAGSPIALPRRTLSERERRTLERQARALDTTGYASMIDYWRRVGTAATSADTSECRERIASATNGCP